MKKALAALLVLVFMFSTTMFVSALISPVSPIIEDNTTTSPTRPPRPTTAPTTPSTPTVAPTTPSTDKNGTDKNGTDINGTDKNGTDINGTDKNGTDINGTDKNGTDKNGNTRTARPDRNPSAPGTGFGGGTVSTAMAAVVAVASLCGAGVLLAKKKED